MRITPSERHPEIDWERPLGGKVALVTGASRGIGAEVARVLARDGARVVGLDVPQLEADLDRLMGVIGGSSLPPTSPRDDAPKLIVDQLEADHGGVDIVVHNAGVTKDKTLGRMDEERWTVLMEINLSAEERINDELLGRDLLRSDGRMVCVSSICRDRGQRGPDELRDVEGGGDRHGAVDGAGVRRAPGDDQRRRPGLHRDGDDRGDADRHARGRQADELDEPGRAAGRCRRDDRLARESRDRPGVNGNVVRVCGQSLIGA